MPKLIFTQEEINAYVSEEKEAMHPWREENIRAANRIAVHAEGKFPEDLITERRPNEPKEVLEYREKIFVAKTKPTFSKVFSSLQKIRRSQEWSINYPSKKFTRINEQETLYQYCEKKYPFFTSITNWIFDVVLRKYLIDPNAVGFVYVPNMEVEENEYVKPICEIFSSENVIDFMPEDYAVLKIEAGVNYYHDGHLTRGTSFYVVTTERIMRYDQTASNVWTKVSDMLHELGELPVFQLKGIVIDHTAKGFKYESRIAAMLPELDEAIREYSDLQAAKVLHIYPERYEYTNTDCKACRGLGKYPNPAWTVDCGCEAELTCSTCHGLGVVSNYGPYAKMLLKPNNNAVDGNTAFLPPPGYVQKDTGIVELQETGVKNHLYYALAAINYEFLAEAPLSTSGVSKEFDRDEANNWTHSVGEDIVAFADSVYWFTAKYRYKNLYSDDDIESMLPSINVPERFDLVSSTQMQKELTDAKNGKFNPLIQSALEDSYTAARFSTEPEVRKRLQLTFKLDPLPNVSEDEKMSMLSNGGISKESYIISSNINEFIQRAIDADKSFVDIQLPDQKRVLSNYAKELLQPLINTDELMTIQDYGV